MEKEKSARPWYKKVNFGHIIATIVVIFGAITMLVPYLWMVSASFKTNTECYATEFKLFPEKFILKSYIQIFTDPQFYTSILYTLIIEVSVIVVGTLVASLAAFAFAKRGIKVKCNSRQISRILQKGEEREEYRHRREHYRDYPSQGLVYAVYDEISESARATDDPETVVYRVSYEKKRARQKLGGVICPDYR